MSHASHAPAHKHTTHAKEHVEVAPRSASPAKSIDDIRGDVEAIKAQVERLLETPGAVSSDGNAIAQALATRVNVLHDKVRADVPAELPA